MNRQQLLARLDQAWLAFQASYAGLTDAQMVAPGVTDDWSVKDLIAHVTWWEEEAIKHLPEIAEGITPARYATQYGGIDAFNAQMTTLKHDLPLAAVLRQMEDTHRRLVAYLQTIPEDHFARETRFRRRLRLDTYSHYPIHTQAIWAWRQQHGF